MKRVLGAILFVLYAIIAITVTILLLSYNDYNISQIGDYTVYIAKDDLFEPRFEEGSILIIEKVTDKNVSTGDEVFLYQVKNTQEWEYLFGIVIVSLLLFLQEVFDLIIEIKYGSKATKNSKVTTTTKKASPAKTATAAKKVATAAKKVATTAKATQVNNDIQTGEKEG